MYYQNLKTIHHKVFQKNSFEYEEGEGEEREKNMGLKTSAHSFVNQKS